MVAVGHARHVADLGKLAHALESFCEHLVVSSQEIKLAGENDCRWPHLQDIIASSSWEQLVIVLLILVVSSMQLESCCHHFW